MPAIPKQNNLHDEKRLAAVRRLPCAWCGIAGSTQAAHSNLLSDGKGKGLKAPDDKVAALCQRCHDRLDNGMGDKADLYDIWRFSYIRTRAWLKEKGFE